MATWRFCEEKSEIALINSEDESRSPEFRADMAKAAQIWGELADRLLEHELKQALLPEGVLKRA